VVGPRVSGRFPEKQERVAAVKSPLTTPARWN
jgi:hypothetical protein